MIIMLIFIITYTESIHAIPGDGCKPYPIEPEKATTGDSGNQQFYYPIKCPQVCTNPAFSGDYFSDKVKGQFGRMNLFFHFRIPTQTALNYNVVGTLEENPSKKWPGPNPKKGGFSWEQTMKEELLKNGSITVDYLLYGDFFDYPTKLGIYEVIPHFFTQSISLHSSTYTVPSNMPTLCV
jgi:hypothetical protein